MKKDYKSNASKKLAAYSALAGAFIAAGSDAKAQVVYTDIADETVDIGELYFLDIDADGNDDLLFQATSTSGGSWSFVRVFGSITTSAYAFGNSSNEVLGYSGAFLPYGSALDSGVPVGPGGSFLTYYNVAFLASIYGGVTYGQFADVDDKYLGVKFVIGGDLHYGWIRMDGTVSPVSVTIKDYAYDASADTEILTGDVGTATPTTYYEDADDDTFGNDASSIEVVGSAPDGYVADNTDCDDTNAAVHPGATEVTNSVDDDCDGLVDENVAIQDVNNTSATVNIYPVPNNGDFTVTINFENAVAQEMLLEIYNISGESLFQQTLVGNAETEKSLHLTNYPAGVYILKLTAEDKLLVKHFIVE